MNQLPPKYNPAFSSDPELLRLFSVRQKYLDLLTEVIRENIGPSNQHILLVGPRGIGKTTLARRLIAAVRQDPVLSERWLPVMFQEEAYEVSTPGEFWLEALARLAEQTGSIETSRIYSQLKTETDEARLRERSLGELLSFSQRLGKRMLLIVENLNMLVGQQLSSQAAWDLRHTLLNERGLMLLATAVSRFEGIDNVGKAWFELFTIYTLPPLTAKECGTLYHSITGGHLPHGQARAIQILTGGNPRLIRILAEFSQKKSFRDLLSDLMHVVDDHTEYFKSQIDSLPPTERKVFVAVLDAWDPVTAQQVARAARINVSKASALLNRLVSRGGVTITEKLGHKRLYQATERLYNIYYLVRKHGHPSARVRAAVHFMTHFYRRAQLVNSTAELAREACNLDAASRGDLLAAYQEILNNPLSADCRSAIIRATPKEFFDFCELPKDVLDSAPAGPNGHSALHKHRGVHDEAYQFISRGEALREKGKYSEAEEMLRRAVALAPDDGHALAHLGALLFMHLDRLGEAKELLERATQLAPRDWWAWLQKGLVAHSVHDDSAAAVAFQTSADLNPSSTLAWHGLSLSLHDLGRYAEAEFPCRKAIETCEKPGNSMLWARFAELLHNHLDRFDEAEEAYKNAIALANPEHEDGWLWVNYAEFLEHQRKRPNEAETYYAKAERCFEGVTKEKPQDGREWNRLGRLYARRPDGRPKAEAAFRKALDADPSDLWNYNSLGELLLSNNQAEDVEALYTSGVESNPNSAPLWYLLSRIRLQLGKPAEAESALAKAVVLNPDEFHLRAELGDLKLEGGRTDEAIEDWRASIAIGGWKSPAWPSLLLADRQSNNISAKEFSDKLMEYVNQSGRSPETLADVSLKIAKTGSDEILPLGEALASELLARRNEVGDAALLCTVFVLERKWTEALGLVPRIFEAAGGEGTEINAAISLSIATAAGGHAKEILEMLGTSTGRGALEPLEIGLKEYLGESPAAPQEIAEVAHDIAEKIKACAESPARLKELFT